MTPSLALLLAVLAAVLAPALGVFAAAPQVEARYSAHRAQQLASLRALLEATFSKLDVARLHRWRWISTLSAGLVATIWAQSALVGLVVAFVVHAAPRVVLERRARARRKIFETQLEDTIVVMANVLRTSPTVVDAVRLAQEAMPAPTSEELALVLSDARLGASVDEALQRLSTRMKSSDLDIVLVAIAVGRAVGGNLGAMLDQLATSMREMKRLEGLIESKTAEGRMQARVMGGMPVVIGLFLYVLDPKMITPLFTENLGLFLLVLIVTFQLAGVALIHKLSRLDV